jgi:hypothetical protein
VDEVTTGADKPRSYNGDYMAAGKRAEAICMAFLRRSPSVVDMDDLRDLRPMQKADCDCTVHLMNGQVHLAEIKSDKHLGVSGNVLFEVLRINHTCEPQHALTLGWSGRSPAQYLLYYSPTLRKLYMTSFSALQRAFQAYTQRVREGMRISVVKTDSIKTTVNVLLPWDECKQCFTVYDVSDIADELQKEEEAPALR